MEHAILLGVQIACVVVEIACIVIINIQNKKDK